MGRVSRQVSGMSGNVRGGCRGEGALDARHLMQETGVASVVVHGDGRRDAAAGLGHVEVRVAAAVVDGVPRGHATALLEVHVPLPLAELLPQRADALVELHLDPAVALDRRELGPHLALAHRGRLEEKLARRVRGDVLELLPRVLHDDGDVTLPLLAEQLGEIEGVDPRHEIEHLRAPVPPLGLQKLGNHREYPVLRREPPLQPENGHDVRVGLRDDEVVDVEQLAQSLHRQVVLEAPVPPPPGAELTLGLPRHERAVAALGQERLRREQRRKRARGGDSRPHHQMRRGEVI